ncbi:hypothetical protein [uncultured Psychroserpens sp.]|uniref:hypothetical protein n=1 Tax=uncultured Psychroserpens sp. TaxID=255436 RepID=UPI00262F1683|nr:hypothetical protein [uncultured Psychroserpens sp.]
MKNILYILLILFLINCKNNEQMNIEDLKVESVEIDEEIIYSSKINHQTIATHKLEEYFDLLKLKENHPNFKDDILLQLNALSKDRLLDYNIAKILSIENIEQIGEIKKVSDSVEKLQLKFNIVLENETITDSILAIITSRPIILDGEEIISNKITFSRFD